VKTAGAFFSIKKMKKGKVTALFIDAESKYSVGDLVVAKSDLLPYLNGGTVLTEIVGKII